MIAQSGVSQVEVQLKPQVLQGPCRLARWCRWLAVSRSSCQFKESYKALNHLHLAAAVAAMVVTRVKVGVVKVVAGWGAEHTCENAAQGASAQGGCRMSSLAHLARIS